MAHSFDPTLIEVVCVERPELEIPHDFGGRIRIGGIDQRKRKAGDITLEVAVSPRETCGEYCSVAALYGGGQSRWPVGTIFIVMPCLTRVKFPGLTRPATFDALSGVITLRV